MEKIVVLGYEVILGWDSGDRIYVAQCFALPGCMAHGDTQEEAAAEIKIAIQGHIELAQELGRPVAKPDKMYA